jgi:hypothetical protein
LSPLAPKNIKPSVSAALPPPMVNTNSSEILGASPNVGIPLKSRRSRGLSVSSLRPSLTKSKSDRIAPSASSESLSEPLRIQKLPSWMSIGSANDNNKVNNANTQQPAAEEEVVAVTVPVVKVTKLFYLFYCIHANRSFFFRINRRSLNSNF